MGQERLVGFGLNSWTTGDRVGLRDDLRAAAAVGYSFVEMRDEKIERHLAAGGSLRELRERAADAGLRILSVNTLENATYATGAELEERTAQCHRLAAWAEVLDCPYIIVGPSYPPLPDTVLPDIGERAVAALSRYAAVAATYGRRIAFEFHGYARCTINRLDQATRILDDLGDPAVGLVIDAFHFHAGASSFDDLAAIDPTRLFIIHLADVDEPDRSRLGKPNRVMPGDGVLPLAELVGAIQRASFEGPYSLELFREEYWAMDPLVVARRGIESMKRFV